MNRADVIKLNQGDKLMWRTGNSNTPVVVSRVEVKVIGTYEGSQYNQEYILPIHQLYEHEVVKCYPQNFRVVERGTEWTCHNQVGGCHHLDAVIRGYGNEVKGWDGSLEHLNELMSYDNQGEWYVTFESGDE